MLTRVALLAVLCVAVHGEKRTFGAFSTVDPTKYYMPTWNPVPEDYCAHPRYPILPTPGDLPTNIINDTFGADNAKPTNSWLKGLWGFQFDDFKNWGGVYAYPYIVYPKEQNVIVLYSGAPVNERDNGRMEFRVEEPKYNNTRGPPIHNVSYPTMVMAATYDIGLIVWGTKTRIAKVHDLGATVEYYDENTKEVVCSLYIMKGSPFVNMECNNARLALGNFYPGVPPIIELNGLPCSGGFAQNGTNFKVTVAEGPAHPQAKYWHVYFDSDVTIQGAAALEPLNLTAEYTGLVQLAAGELDDAMKDYLDTNAGVYATDASIEYDVTGDESTITFNYDVQRKAGKAQGLPMLALPHHWSKLQGVTFTDTKFWCTRGPLKAINADSMVMKYNLTTQGFGDEKVVPDNMKDAVKKAVAFDYSIFMKVCPGDNVTGQGLPGYKNMELYAYARDLAKYTDVAIAAMSLGETAMAANMTQHVIDCMAPIMKRPTELPKPCPPAINNTAVCVRDLLDVYYDTTYGGLITGWYERFAPHYCQCDVDNPPNCEGLNYCDNPTGWNGFANYGNAFYNDHHFQYGYIVKSMAWALYLNNVKKMDLGFSAGLVQNMTDIATLFARDYANPDNTEDKYFTYLRHKDQFDGHSWAEGYDYSGRIMTWNNQQSSGEALNSYYALALLGTAIGNKDIYDWGRIHAATEIAGIQSYNQMSNQTDDKKNVPYSGVTNITKCLSILHGNGATGATYYGPNYLFECGIIMLPVTPITHEVLPADWAKETVEFIEWHTERSGYCVFPDPILNATNPCHGNNSADWWGNEWGCCPATFFEGGFPNNQWRTYPDWLPYQYVMQSAYDKEGAWKKLQITDETKGTADLPFPYINRWGGIVGYQHDMSRSSILFYVATQ